MSFSNWFMMNDSSLVSKLVDEKDRDLLRHAKYVDHADRWMGPFESLSGLYGDPLFQTLGNLVTAVELLALKIPFISFSGQENYVFYFVLICHSTKDNIVHWMQENLDILWMICTSRQC